MPRKSPVYYIAPSAISLLPNCNESPNDIEVTLARGAKIKVYAPDAGIGVSNTSYAEWTLKGRNRRLADSSKPYTIYARLPKGDKTKGYLVFAPKNGSAGSGWSDKYAYVTPSGIKGPSGATVDQDNFYVLMGSVSLPENGLRTLTLDTGILGTDQYNSEWTTNPDVLQPITITCTIDGEDAGPTPYVYWGKTLVLTATLGGWADIDIERFDHWEIVRSTGNDTSDATWLTKQKVSAFGQSGTIDLEHSRDDNDDFGGAVAPMFRVTAYGETRYGTTIQIATASVSVLAETLENYNMDLSAAFVTYNPMTRTYTPADGVIVRVRATDQKGEMFRLTRGQFLAARLTVRYSVVESGSWTALTLEDGDADDEAKVIVPISVFQQQKGVELSLINYYEKELAAGSIAFLRDGEDGKEREWIFLHSAELIEFGDISSDHPLPALITMGEVSPSGTAGSVTPYDSTVADWVPAGWTDDATGTTEEIPYEYASHRDYVHESEEVSVAHWGEFTEPAMWSHFGHDGVGIDSITRTYAISAYGTTANDDTPPPDVTVWSAGSPAVTEAQPFLWVKEVTVYTDPDKNTTKYYCVGRRGDNGIDAQDVEWAYIRTKSILPPVIYDDTAYTDSNGHTYLDDDHLPRVVVSAGNTDIESDNSGVAGKPFECTDDPKGTNDTWKYEWEIKRTKGSAVNGHRTWNPYSGTMILRTDPAFWTYIGTIIGSGSGNANTVALAQRAVLGALDGITVTDGGLMLTSLIVMRKLRPGGNPSQLSSYDTWAGISGMYDAEVLGTGIAAWYGGSMVDYEGLTDEEKTDGWDGPVYHQRWAKSLFRFDGSGYVAGGNVSWNNLGDVVIRGSVVQDASFVIDGTNVTGQLRNLLRMFTLEGAGTSDSPYIIKANYGLYTEQFLSALGIGSGGGGGGGASVLDDLLDVVITNPAQDQVLKYNGTHWVNANAPSGGGADMNTVWTALAAATNEQINASHLSNALSGLFSSLAMSGNDLSITIGGTNRTLTVGYATSAGSVAWGNVSGKPFNWSGQLGQPTWLWGSNNGVDYYVWNPSNFSVNYATSAGSAPASDVYSWAKASTKPSYGFNELTSHPTTVSGYGITDMGSQSVNYATSAGSLNTSSTYAVWGRTYWTRDGKPQDVTGSLLLGDGNLIFAGTLTSPTCYISTWGNGAHISFSVSGSAVAEVYTGGIYSALGVTAASDIRKKDVVSHFELDIEKIASASLIKFRWKDKHELGIFAGGIAQEWEKILPEAVRDNDGTLSMDYGVLALSSSVSLARKVVEQQKEIDSLKARLERLEKLLGV